MLLAVGSRRRRSQQGGGEGPPPRRQQQQRAVEHQGDPGLGPVAAAAAEEPLLQDPPAVMQGVECDLPAPGTYVVWGPGACARERALLALWLRCSLRPYASPSPSPRDAPAGGEKLACRPAVPLTLAALALLRSKQDAASLSQALQMLRFDDRLAELASQRGLLVRFHVRATAAQVRRRGPAGWTACMAYALWIASTAALCRKIIAAILVVEPAMSLCWGG